MPILVKNYTWRQSAELVFIRVPLNGVHNSKVDVFLTDNFIKLSYPPFLFEIFLCYPIKDSEGICRFTNEEALIDLVKVDNINWDNLEADISKSEKVRMKEKIIEEAQIKTRKQLDDKIQHRSDLNKFSINQAIEFDTKRREKLESLRDLERKIAMNDLEEWRQTKCIIPTNDYENKIENNKDDFKKESTVQITEIFDEESELSDIKKTIVKDTKNIPKPKHQPKSEPCKPLTSRKSQFYQKVMTDLDKRIIPPLRKAGVLNVKFTERIFPTPSRESSARDEEIWLKKVNEARRASGFVSEDLRPEEQDPQWCKDKGDEFFRVGNYLGAISAYSHGIKLSNKLPSLFTNRAASQFALGNFNKCVEDCSEALELLKPPCEANLGSRVKCITRRAAALTRIGMLNKAIDEMKVAIRLQPNNEKLKEDLYEMERAWEQNPDSD